MANIEHEQEIVIRPPEKLAGFDFRELYRFRHMFWSKVWRDIRLQFNEMYLSVFWSVSRPLAMLAVFAFIKKSSGANMHVSIPYSLYLYSGLILWFYFVESLSSSSRSIAKDANLIKKIYFPRMMTPLVPVFSNLFGLFIGLVPLAVMMIWQGVVPGWRIVLLPLVLVLCMTLSLGAGTMFASLSLASKDSEKMLKLILYLGLFVSPVIYSPDMLTERAKIIFSLNPMVGILLSFRSCLFAEFPFPLWENLYSASFALLLLVVGTTMFRRAEMYFADKL